MEQKTIKIALPFFCGFYESPLFNSDTLYYEFHDEENLEYYRDCFGDETLTEDDLDIDFNQYKEDVSKAFVDAFYNSDDCPDFVEYMEFAELVSPKYYNYSTDKVYANVTLSDDWREKALAFMEKNKVWLTKRISAEWTSRDGYISLMPNTYEQWYKEFETNPLPDECFISTIIEYIMEVTNKNVRECLLDDTLSDVYISQYIIDTKENEGEGK